MPAIPTRNKDPDAIEWFSVDWSAALGDDTLTASEWEVPAGVTQEAATNTATAARVKLSGGTAGETYRVTNRVTTSGGETLDQSIDVYVTDL